MSTAPQMSRGIRGRTTASLTPRAVHFLAAHPLLTVALGFILGQFSLLMVLGLCSSAAGRRDERFEREVPREIQREPSELLPRRHRIRTPAREHLQAT